VRRIKRLLFAYNSFLKDTGRLTWWFGVVIYPLIAAIFVMLLGVYIHPLAGLIPMIPPLIVAIREDIRRGKVLMSEAYEVIGERWQKAFDDYVELVKRQEEQNEQDESV
jgi:hypothetical protein